MNTQSYKPNPIARLLVILVSLPLAYESVARAQLNVPLRSLHPRNKNPPTNSLANAWQQAQKMKYDPATWPGVALPKTSGPNPLVATLNTNNWEWLGPGNIGGRTRSIVVHPTQPGTIWVGGVGGGVWKTTNNAASFFPCDDWMGSLAVSCMALDQTNPNVLYAGTGEGFGNGDAIPGVGVFKSYDGGSNWVQLNNFLLNNYYINRLAISPSNNKVILAATSAGIVRSTDAGTNWSSTFLSGGVLDVAFNPTNGMRCVAAAGNNSISGLALYSTNGGSTWTGATGVATNGRIELAYAPSNPNIVYASQDTNNGTLWISIDGGTTYTLRNTGSNYLGSQGFYANCIWVDPNSPSNLVVGGLDLWRSTDGGATLRQISDWTINANNNAMISVHADHHAIVSVPGFDAVTNPVVYFGNDGGLYCATNIYAVTPLVGWLNLNNNLGITQPYGIAANPTTFTTIIGSQDTGSTKWSPAQGTSWNIWGLGDGGFCAADPTDPNYFYGEYTYLQIYRSNNGTRTQSYIYGGIADAGTVAGYDDDDPAAPHNANFIAPFVLDPNNPNTMLAGGSNLWRSVNVKAPTPTWTCITTNNANPRLDFNFISAIAVAPGNSDVIWIGYSDGVVYQSTNGTGAFPKWTRKSPGPVNACAGLAIDPSNAKAVYACFSGFGANNLYRTTDGGSSWTNLSAGLPAAPLHSVVVAPFNSSYIYVGSDLGVFGSADQGVSWSPANEGPANVQVLNLAWARNYLLAATHGRGAYRIALGPPTIVLTPASVTNYVGSSAIFSASVVGQPALGLQWTFAGKNVAGANSSTLTLTNLQTTDSGVYTLWASNSFGSGSASVTLTVVDPPPYYAQAVAGGPVAYWRLNETAGATAYDSVGGYNGTNNGLLILGVSGPTPPEFPGFEPGNTAYQFDGTTTSVGLPALNLNTNTVTITAWVNLNGTQQPAGIFSWRGGGNAAAQFLFGDTNNSLSASWNGNLLASTLVVPTNQWTFVGLVVSPTNTAIYMATNSILASWTSSGANDVAAFDSESFIGAGPSGNFRGAIDEVTVYNQSLTLTKISNQLAASQSVLPVVTLTAPANGSSFVSFSNIQVTASVIANGHAIGNVQFFSGPSLLGQSATPPYQATLSGATPGSFTLLAQATYDGSKVVSSLPVTITVTNLPPTPANDSTNTIQNTPVTIDALANDTDPYNLPLTLQSVAHPGRGTAVIAGTNIIYTPYDYWFGVDTFDYTVNDGFGATASAAVTVTTPFPNFTSTYTNAILNLGPVAYWRLNETSGTTAFDSAGEHHGTNNGSLLLGISGPIGPQFPGFEPTNTAYQFNGTNTSISFPALNLNSTNLTITVWLDSNASQTTNAGIVSWGGTNTFWFGFGSYAFDNNTLAFERDSFSYLSSLVVPSNRWSFVALVLGPATNSGTFYLATNSTLASYPISLFSFFATAPTIFTNTAYLGYNAGNYFNGAMDEVAIFNKSLTSTQIGDLLAAALTGGPSVAMTAPTNGTSFNSASNILLSASVTTNGNHTVEKVQFYNTNSTLLGEAIAPPYRYQWTGMPAGNYSVFARANYDGSATVDSTTVSLIVTNSVTVTATGTATGVLNPGGFPVMTGFSGTAGHVFYVQRSTNFVSWATILTTNAPANGLFICTDNFSDLAGPPPYAFYRLSWAP